MDGVRERINCCVIVNDGRANSLRTNDDILIGQRNVMQAPGRRHAPVAAGGRNKRIDGQERPIFEPLDLRATVTRGCRSLSPKGVLHAAVEVSEYIFHSEATRFVQVGGENLAVPLQCSNLAYSDWPRHQWSIVTVRVLEPLCFFVDLVETEGKKRKSGGHEAATAELHRWRSLHCAPLMHPAICDPGYASDVFVSSALPGVE